MIYCNYKRVNMKDLFFELIPSSKYNHQKKNMNSTSLSFACITALTPILLLVEATPGPSMMWILNRYGLRAKILVVLFVIAVIKYIRKRRIANRMSKISNHAHQVRQDARDDFMDWLKVNRIHIPNAKEREEIATKTASVLIDDMKNKRIPVTDVMVTMCLRAIVADKTLACNTDEMFMAAVKKAQAEDEFLKSHGPDECGPLFGLPISIKDQIAVAGTDSTCGIVGRYGKPFHNDATVVSTLVEAGAIPFVKTNLPQLMLLPESGNPLWGNTRNPWNTSRSAGGSSGGEGALIAGGGSILGIGTDIGGSIRIPAHCCGISGFKPTPKRISSSGIKSATKSYRVGQQLILSAAGPMAKRVCDLKLCMKVLLEQENFMFREDKTFVPIPYRQQNNSRIRIGYFENDGYFDSSPSCRRAVREAKIALEKAGHILVPFEVPNPDDFVRLMIEVNSSDGSLRNCKSGLGDEPLIAEYNKMDTMASMPKPLKYLFAYILRKSGNKRTSLIMENAGFKTAYEYWQLAERVDNYREAFVHAMKDLDVQAILCPGGTLPAMAHGEAKDLFVSCSTTFLFNVLHFPAGAVPVTVTRPDETEYTSSHHDLLVSFAKKSLAGAAGLPVGVQIAAMPWEDELCLDIMEDLEKQIRFYEDFENPFKQ